MQPWATIYAIRYTLEFTPDVSSLAFLSGASLFTLSHLYTCRDASTNQLLNMQNKPNLVRRRRIANSVCTMDYEVFILLAGQKNKPNSNPIKPNLQIAKMNINSIITKDYRKKDDFTVRINKPNFFKGQK